MLVQVASQGRTLGQRVDQRLWHAWHPEGVKTIDIWRKSLIWASHGAIQRLGFLNLVVGALFEGIVPKIAEKLHLVRVTETIMMTHLPCHIEHWI